MNKDDSYYMNICNRLAEKAALNGNPAVGCVIVKNGQILSKAAEASKTKRDITCHAEIEAIRKAIKKAGSDISGCILYTTHEPCIMCAYPIRYYAISKIVINLPVSILGGLGVEFPLLTTTKLPPHWPAPPEIAWFKTPVL